MSELTVLGSPKVVRAWAQSPPDWIVVRTPTGVDASIQGTLHAGEAQALALCVELGADLLLIDERRGTRLAQSIGIEATGMLGILDVAAARGLLHLGEVLDRLSSTNFRMTTQLRDYLSAREAGRTRGQVP